MSSMVARVVRPPPRARPSDPEKLAATGLDTVYVTEKGSLRSDRGVLRVRVPAGVGAGEHPVSLISEGEESQPATINVSP